MKPLSEEQRKEFEQVCEPVMKFLCENFHPHVCVTIDPSRAELFEGQVAINNDKYFKD